MSGGLNGLYLKGGARYLRAGVAVVVTFAMYLFALLTMISGGLYFSSSFTRLEHLIELCLASLTVALVAVLLGIWRSMTRIVDWVEDGRSPIRAPGVWQQAIELPARLVLPAAMVFVVVALPLEIYAAFDYHVASYYIPAIIVSGLVGVAGAAVFAFFAIEIVLRPVVEDAASRAPVGSLRTDMSIHIRRRAIIGFTVPTIVTGFYVAGMVTGIRGTGPRIAVALAFSILVALTIGLLIVAVTSNTILNPVSRLIEATERVRRLEFSGHIPVTTADELGALTESFNTMLLGLRQRARLEQALGSYTHPSLATQMALDGQFLEGRDASVTAMFVDIRDFTRYAESVSPREAVSFLNDFFELAGAEVTDHGGHVNKFIGDGLLAVFGAPQEIHNPAVAAITSACALVTSVERTFGSNHSIGIGIHSGEVLIGTIGGGGKLDFTVIGDAVNVASRVEQLTKELGDSILLTRETAELAPELKGSLTPRGEHMVRGRNSPVQLFAPHSQMTYS